MTRRRNLNPVPNTDQPTEYVRVGKTIIGDERTVVKIENGGSSAHFYAEPMDDVMTSNKGKVKFHENIAALFGSGEGVDGTSPFIVETPANQGKIPDCDSVELFLQGSISRSELERYLQNQNYLLHPIEEVFDTSDGFASAEVVSLSPSRHTTVRVTEETDIEFLDREAYEKRKRSRQGGGRGGPGGAGDGQPGPGAGGTEEVDIDISPEKPTVSFETDVAGLEEVKQTAQMLLALFDSETKQEVVERYGENFASQGGSMLLYGPPGCGKTLVSEAIAYEAANNTNLEEEYGEVKFLPVKGGDILSRYPGEAERRVEAVFDQAHDIAQDGFAVLFFDEIETLIPDRGDEDLQRHERSLTNAFLQEMGTDKIEDNLLVIGATNMPFTIDPAASRRFPIQQFIPQPGDEVMAEVWRTELSSLEEARGSTVDIDYERLGGASIGYTPAEIADRVLGTELQRELVRSVVDEDQDPIEPSTDYLLGRLEENDPKTIRQYITSVREEVDELEGYPEMRRYVEQQADDLDISLGGGPLEQALRDVQSGESDHSTE
jgi:transitional endoplasmic reticulum ATPase